MRDIGKLVRGLLHSEFEAARDLHYQARNLGHSTVLAAALCYRQGYQEGTKVVKWKTAEAYYKLSQAEKALTDAGIELPVYKKFSRIPPEFQTGIKLNEGSNDNE